MSTTVRSSATIKAYRQENNLLYVSLDCGVYNVNGKRRVLSSSEEIILDEGTILELVRITQEIVHYEHIDTKEQKSISEYTAEKQELLTNGLLTNGLFNDGDSSWKSITARHAYELFIDRWKPVHHDVENCIRINFEIVGEAPINHPYVLPIRKLDGNLTNTLYRYDPGAHAYAVFREILLKNDFVELKTDPGSNLPAGVNNGFYTKNNKLEFGKIIYSTIECTITGGFITLVIPMLEKYKVSSRMSGTFEDLTTIFNENDVEIRNCVHAFLNKNNPMEKLGFCTVGDISDALFYISKKLDSIEVLSKNRDEFDAVKNKVQNTIKLLSMCAAKI